VGPATGVKS